MTESSTSLWTSVGLFVATALASQLVQNAMRSRETQSEEDAFEEWRKGYQRNRLGAGRLSCGDADHFACMTEGDSQQRRKEAVALELSESNDNVNDFQPKNSNWAHFEPVEEGLSDDEESSDDDDDDTSSSEEAFLWTSSHRSTTNHSSEETWTSKLKGLASLLNDSSHHGSVDSNFGSSDDGFAGEEVGWKSVPSPKRRILTRHQSAPLEWTKKQEMPPQVQNRAARAKYNSRIMPNKVVLLRHGQSMGNIDEGLYATTPDNAMPITKLGWEQARMAGKVLKEQVLASGESVHFVVSPYVRTVETFHGVVSAWCDPAEFKHIKDRNKRLKAWYGRLLELGLTWHEDPRIREQDFGNYQNPESIEKSKRERHRFGIFFYRFPNGESASDVFDRVSTFLDSLWRSFDLNRSRNYVLITHGISIRVLLARYFRYTIAQFSMLANPRNGEMVILRHDGKGRLRLGGRCELDLVEEQGEKRVTGCTFHERLRTVPSQYVHKVKIRISYDDD